MEILYPSGIITIPFGNDAAGKNPFKKVPPPISSLTIPIHESESVNPRPIPSPSKNEGSAGFFEA